MSAIWREVSYILSSPSGTTHDQHTAGFAYSERALATLLLECLINGAGWYFTIAQDSIIEIQCNSNSLGESATWRFQKED